MKPIPIALCAGCILGCGIIIGVLLARMSVHDQPISSDSHEVFQALMEISAMHIPEKSVACELTGKKYNRDNGGGDLTLVSDFITSYLAWSLQDQGRGRLDCDGTSVKQCTWSYGDNSQMESWDRFLKFEYNTQTKYIDPNTLHCIDVP
ncbi:hypothetical protein [Aeromonas tecta]|uniref:hypothetical protein n=1 Tax=Aeromonas tecta TaxID=324617 RepID=UPI0012FA1FC0|nr:hypothetical protein [Aeromonas tecta]